MIGQKESACSCAGISNPPFAIESYAATFDEDRALDALEAFASEHGPRFYGLPLNMDSIVLERVDIVVHQRITLLPDGEVVPFHAGETSARGFAMSPRLRE